MKSNHQAMCLLLIAIGCRAPQTATIKAFIPGAYARSVQNEFSEGKDTLIIQNVGEDIYSIEHRMTYQRMADGKAGAVERKKERWTALWDEKSEALMEQKKGRLLTFQPEANTLLVGSSLYKRLY